MSLHTRHTYMLCDVRMPYGQWINQQLIGLQLSILIDAAHKRDGQFEIDKKLKRPFRLSCEEDEQQKYEGNSFKKSNSDIE